MPARGIPIWRSATTTKSWASRGAWTRASSRRPTASSRCSTTRTAIPTIPRPRSASRRPPRPTRCSPIRRSGAPTTASASPGVGGGGPAASPTSATSAASATSSTTSSAISSEAARGGRRRGRGQRGADLRYNLEIDLARRGRGLEAQIEIPKMRACETCGGSGRAPGHQPRSLLALSGHRSGRPAAGLLPHQPALRRLRRRGRGRARALSDCRGAGPRRGPADDQGARAARRRRRHAPAPDGRGRGRHRRRPAGRPLRGDLAEAAPACSSATGRTSTARCRSRSRRPRSARRSRCRPSRAR